MLRVGSEDTGYYVASGLLQNPNWIDSACWGIIQLPDVDANTGHVLVHFLWTGTYQTLHNIDVSPEEEVRVEFKQAFLAFAVAHTYELAGLQRLAMDKIKQFGQRMTIFDIVDTIDENFSSLSHSTTEFQDYLTMKARDAFQKNHNDLCSNGIFDRITNVALSKTLAKCVMELYENKITHMLQAEQLMCEMLAKYRVTSEREMGEEKKEEATAGDAASSGVSLPGDDDWGAFAPSKDKMAAEELAEPTPEPVVEEPIVEEAVVEEAVVDPFAGLRKFQRRKLERKMKEEAAAKATEDAQREMIEAEAATLKSLEDEEALYSWGSASKKKKKKKGAEEEPSPPPPLEPELVPESEPSPPSRAIAAA